MVYYIYELFVHGIKQWFFIDMTLIEQLDTNIMHEFVDQVVIYCLGVIVTLASQSNNQLGGGIIDISYGNFSHNIREIIPDINYECSITIDN